MLNNRITTLKKHIMDYTFLVEQMLQAVIKGLVERDEKYLKDVVLKKEPVANDYEIEFDEICANTIAQYQPVSKNLRTLISIIKMSNDLERMADHCVNIANYSLELIKEPEVKELKDLPKMAACTDKMLKDSIQSFIDEDSVLAKNTCAADSEVDSLNKIIKEDLAKLIKVNPQVTNNALKLIYISSNLERIADLSTNICEEVIYFTQGSVIKHHFDSNS